MWCLYPFNRGYSMFLKGKQIWPNRIHLIVVSWRNFQRMLRCMHASAAQWISLNAVNQMRRRISRRPFGPRLPVVSVTWVIPMTSGWRVRNCIILFSMRCSTKGLQSRANHLGRISPKRKFRCQYCPYEFHPFQRPDRETLFPNFWKWRSYGYAVGMPVLILCPAILLA